MDVADDGQPVDLAVVAARCRVTADRIRHRAAEVERLADSQSRRVDRAAGRRFAKDLRVIADRADKLGADFQEILGGRS